MLHVAWSPSQLRPFSPVGLTGGTGFTGSVGLTGVSLRNAKLFLFATAKRAQAAASRGRQFRCGFYTSRVNALDL